MRIRADSDMGQPLLLLNRFAVMSDNLKCSSFCNLSLMTCSVRNINKLSQNRFPIFNSLNCSCKTPDLPFIKNVESFPLRGNHCYEK